MKEKLISEFEALIKKIEDSKSRFGDKDIRTSFLDGYFQILRTYYCAYYHLESEDIVKRYSEIYRQDNIDKKNLELHFQGHRNLLNSFLIINCWSNFELFITLFCNTFLNEQAVHELLEIDSRRILKLLGATQISEQIKKKIIRLKKHHIAHAPIINKYGKLFKMVQTYPEERNRNDDRNFLEFFGRLRNCIHSNYIYYGAVDRDFKYNGEIFSFKSGKLIDHKSVNDDSIFRLTLNLKEIGSAFIDHLHYDKEIYDPSVELME